MPSLKGPDEFAPGIPSSKAVRPIPTIKEPTKWEFGIHRHDAIKAGLHYDLRLGDSQGHAHSWALRHLPGPGEARLAVQQPTHSVGYMDFEGRLGPGYGEGDVALARRDKTEVLSSDDSHVRFNVYQGKNIEEYALRRTKPGVSGWLLQNVTTSRQVGPGQLLPSSKPAYKAIGEAKLNPDDPNTEWEAKIDGAHVLYQFKAPGSMPRVHSYRPTERATGIIEHTQKLPDFHRHTTPPELKDSILRGELYAVNSEGRALPAARVGGLLNANVWKSREQQEREGKLVPVAFDVVRWRGKDVSNEPRSAKRRLLDTVFKVAPWLKPVRRADTPEEKRQLVADIKSGKELSTDEGIIQWHKDKAVPDKVKFLHEKDVVVRGVFSEEGLKRKGTMAGGFEFSYTPDGPIIGRVGTGMSHALKKDLLENPGRYIGLRTRVMAQRAPEHYAPRAPVFHSFHLDQELPEGIKTADAVKKTVDFQGMTVKLDRPKGFVQTGTDDKGKPWLRTYKFDYGFIPKTKGGDGDGLDVFLGPNKDAENAFWAIQKKADGSFDEYKVFLGFNTRAEALAAYKEHIPAKFLSGMTVMRVEMMKALLGIQPEGFDSLKTASLYVGFQDELEKIGEPHILPMLSLRELVKKQLLNAAVDIEKGINVKRHK